METDPRKERERLAPHYAQMNDGELEELASSAAGLTDLAREALQREVHKRKLSVTLDFSAEASMSTDFRLIKLRSFRDLPDALLAKSVLESAEIECFLADEHIVRMDWFYSNAVGGVKLCVPLEEADEAAELFDQPVVDSFYAEGMGGYRQPRCPKCQSLDVAFNELIRSVAYGSLIGMWLVGIVPPIPLRRIGWKCHTCGYGWDDSDEQKDESDSHPM